MSLSFLAENIAGIVGGENDDQAAKEPELAEETAGTEKDAVNEIVSQENEDLLPQEVIEALQKQRYRGTFSI